MPLSHCTSLPCNKAEWWAGRYCSPEAVADVAGLRDMAAVVRRSSSSVHLAANRGDKLKARGDTIA